MQTNRHAIVCARRVDISSPSLESRCNGISSYPASHRCPPPPIEPDSQAPRANARPAHMDERRPVSGRARLLDTRAEHELGEHGFGLAAASSAIPFVAPG